MWLLHNELFRWAVPVGIAAVVLLWGNNLLGRRRERSDRKDANPEDDFHRQYLEVEKEKLRRQKEAHEKEERRRATRLELDEAKRQLEVLEGISTFIQDYYHDVALADKYGYESLSRPEANRTFQEQATLVGARIGMLRKCITDSYEAMTLPRFNELQDLLGMTIPAFDWRAASNGRHEMEDYLPTIEKLYEQAKQKISEEEEAFRREYLV